MNFIAVACVILLLLAALANTYGVWRAPQPSPWYDSVLFYWGMFFLALYVEWGTLVKLWHGN